MVQNANTFENISLNMGWKLSHGIVNNKNNNINIIIYKYIGRCCYLAIFSCVQRVIYCQVRSRNLQSRYTRKGVEGGKS